MRRGTSRLRIELTEYLRDGGSPVEVLEELSRAMDDFIRPRVGVLDDRWEATSNYESAIPKVEKWAGELGKLLRAHSGKPHRYPR